MSAERMLLSTLAPPDTMSFPEFVTWSVEVAHAVPWARRFLETRLARAFPNLIPIIDVPEQFPRIHRCDLARAWCAVVGLPAEAARRALICEGVRHGLTLVLAPMAQERRRLALPGDVYPVYARIAAEARIETLELPTFPSFDVSAILDQAALLGAASILLPAPLALHGRGWTEDEAAQAIAWLRREPSRRLLLDGIYALGRALDEPSRRLLATGQVIYLDSLSKGWLSEQVLGVAIVPEDDLGRYGETFRRLEPSQTKLFRARELLTRFCALPVRLGVAIDDERRVLMRLVADCGLSILPATRGYFVAVEAPASRLLNEHGLLAIPASVFGSRLRHWSIASALPWR